jgi:aspartate carbamoyltransferase catalytic subunit
MFVIRHQQNGLPHHVAANLEGVAILNAGDGINAHPTQALLDMLTIRTYKKSFEQLSVAIIGDIAHSRVAHSDISVLRTLGVHDIRLIAPVGLIGKVEGCEYFEKIEQGIVGADVVMVLRLQKERMLEADIPNEQEYFEQFGLTTTRLGLAKEDAIVMHPGPVNRGVEIDSCVADCSQSVILEQVRNGIAIRMAVMQILGAQL